MRKMRLDIVTPERKLYSEEVEMVITRAAKGDIGILPKHAPLVSTLEVTVVRIKKEGIEEKVAVGGGFLEVRPDQVTILADTAEFPREIDIARAERAKARAEQRLAESKADMIRAKAALMRAVNRLEAVRGSSR
jgi:F-type H+-transporting ATPase subunit epsilon